MIHLLFIVGSFNLSDMVPLSILGEGPHGGGGAHLIMELSLSEQLRLPFCFRTECRPVASCVRPVPHERRILTPQFPIQGLEM